ncbi:uncharacterized protein VTP21DRAFT_2470 [Calcarisporiella thermophila]|uniref:uncharacterized protein n=1 Tax=Calcarisporiella thermophila TaxID=911321 RepID=UPI0037440F90
MKRTTRSRAKQMAETGVPTTPSAARASHDSIKARSKGDRKNESALQKREPLKAYLRLRPCPSNEHERVDTTPYLDRVSDTEVVMNPPEHSNAYKTRNRAPEHYQFTHVFGHDATQHDVFQETALPLVRGVLNGENALLFAYGVTNSGKTYTIQGTHEESGLLPRILGAVFQSLKGVQGDSRIRPVRYSDVELVEEHCSNEGDMGRISDGAGNLLRDSLSSVLFNAKLPDIPEVGVEIDRRCEYSVWVSYMEIYTENIYDLLGNPLARVGDGLKRRALSLKNDAKTNNKYVHGLQEVRVRTLAEAYAILRKGQSNRAVFSTMVNQTSSRSHGIFTVKIVRLPRGRGEEVENAVVSRLSVVDLAGLERAKIAHTTGQRLKEAGDINKGLMVLGQCIELLRANQQLPEGKKPLLIPFRHSKLTEMFKGSFTGDGNAVMIVCVNPFDTGFDENTRVMRFASVAKNVTTSRRTLSHPTSQANPNGKLSNGSSVTLIDDEEEDDYECDPMVDNLLIQLEELREKYIEAECRCATIENDIREEVYQEMADKIQEMEQMYEMRIHLERNWNEEKTDRKLDIFLSQRQSQEDGEPREPEEEAETAPQLREKLKGLEREKKEIRRILIQTKRDLDKERKLREELNEQLEWLARELADERAMLEHLKRENALHMTRMEHKLAAAQTDLQTSLERERELEEQNEELTARVQKLELALQGGAANPKRAAARKAPKRASNSVKASDENAEGPRRPLTRVSEGVEMNWSLPLREDRNSPNVRKPEPLLEKDLKSPGIAHAQKRSSTTREKEGEREVVVDENGVSHPPKSTKKRKLRTKPAVVEEEIDATIDPSPGGGMMTRRRSRMS